jgi:hypothetical protein
MIKYIMQYRRNMADEHLRMLERRAAVSGAADDILALDAALRRIDRAVDHYTRILFDEMGAPEPGKSAAIYIPDTIRANGCKYKISVGEKELEGNEAHFYSCTSRYTMKEHIKIRRHRDLSDLRNYRVTLSLEILPGLPPLYYRDSSTLRRVNLTLDEYSYQNILICASKLWEKSFGEHSWRRTLGWYTELSQAGISNYDAARSQIIEELRQCRGTARNRERCRKKAARDSEMRIDTSFLCKYHKDVTRFSDKQTHYAEKLLASFPGPARFCDSKPKIATGYGYAYAAVECLADLISQLRLPGKRILVGGNRQFHATPEGDYYEWDAEINDESIYRYSCVSNIPSASLIVATTHTRNTERPLNVSVTFPCLMQFERKYMLEEHPVGGRWLVTVPYSAPKTIRDLAPVVIEVIKHNFPGARIFKTESRYREIPTEVTNG